MAVSLAIATLVAVTKEAERALGGERQVPITRFPFKVGRESRTAGTAKAPITELRLGVASDLNDIYLVEPAWSDLLQISREHFAIEAEGNEFYLIDRGSVCGTIVAGKRIGGNRQGGRTPIRTGDLIIVGTENSDYVFRFDVKAQAV